jgi:hypothetical protein
VAHHGDPHQLRRDQGRPQACVLVAGEPGDHGEQFRGQELAQHGGGLVVRDRRADEGQDGVAALVAVDDVQVAANQSRDAVIFRKPRQACEKCGKPGRQAGRGDEEPFLGTEVMDDERGVHLGLGGDAPQRRRIVATSSEPAAGDGQDRLAGIGGS